MREESSRNFYFIVLLQSMARIFIHKYISNLENIKIREINSPFKDPWDVSHGSPSSRQLLDTKPWTGVKWLKRDFDRNNYWFKTINHPCENHIVKDLLFCIFGSLP